MNLVNTIVKHCSTLDLKINKVSFLYGRYKYRVTKINKLGSLGCRADREGAGTQTLRASSITIPVKGISRTSTLVGSELIFDMRARP